jgi:hypothetical protein
MAEVAIIPLASFEEAFSIFARYVKEGILDFECVSENQG